MTQAQDEARVLVKGAPYLRIDGRARGQEEAAVAQALGRRSGDTRVVVRRVDEPHAVWRQELVPLDDLVALVERYAVAHVECVQHAPPAGTVAEAREALAGLRVARVVELLAVEPEPAKQIFLVARHHLVPRDAPRALVRARAAAVSALVNQPARRREDGRLREARVEGGAEAGLAAGAAAARGAEAAVQVEERV